MTMKKVSVALMIPVYNSESVIQETLKSLENQTFPLSKVYLINDNSSDNSQSLLKKYKARSKYTVEIIQHSKNMGLSYTYNEIIRKTTSKLLITLNHDCSIVDHHGIKKLVEPFLCNSGIVESCSFVTTPYTVWRKFNFWQKCLFSRHVGRKMSGRNSTFCCFSVAALRKIGMFDECTFRTGGEDADIIHRLSSTGNVVDVDTRVIHIHSRNSKFSWLDLIKKENQRAESVGASLSKHCIFNPINLARIFLRPLLIYCLIFPQTRILALTGIFLFAFLYTKEVFYFEWRDKRILILPFFNILLLFTYTYYFLKAFILKKQQL